MVAIIGDIHGCYYTLVELYNKIRKNYPDREFFDERDVNPFDYYSMNSYQEKQVHEMLHEALDSLPEMYRQVLTLYYIGGMSGKEIAQFLGTSPSNIRQRLSRARAKLKEEMTSTNCNPVLPSESWKW